jgi:tyrosyl-tRNA synthetase
MFGKVMRLSDELMMSYYELLTDMDLAAVRALHPMEAKKRLAGLLTERFNGAGAGAAERAFFEQTFSKKELPTENIEMRSAPSGKSLSELIMTLGMSKSRNEARRLITQGAVRIDGRKIEDDAAVASPENFVLQVGKHQFVKVSLSPQ